MPGARSRVRAVLFDVGGTLVYEPDFDRWAKQAGRLGLKVDAQQLAEAYATVLTGVETGPAPPAQGTARVDFWRRTLSLAVHREVPGSTVGRFVAAGGESSAPVRLYSDAVRCLEELRGDRRELGIVSNSVGEDVVRTVLHRAGIRDYFAGAVVSSGSEGVEKPDPEIFLRAVRRMHVTPPEAVYVGNLALTDARAAQAAGLHGVWLNREGVGFGEARLEITSLLELPSLVRRIEQDLSTG